MYKYYLTYLGAKSELIAEPIGWDNFETILKRNEKYHGISAEFSELDLQFWCSVSLSILKTAYADDIDSVVLFSVENDSVLEYSGHVDFGDYQHLNDKYEYVKVKVAEIGTQTIFNNRIDQKVDLESVVGFDGATLSAYGNVKYPIELPCVPIVLQAKSESTDDVDVLIEATKQTHYFEFPSTGQTITELESATFNEMVDYDSADIGTFCEITNDKISYIEGKLKGHIKYIFSQNVDYTMHYATTFIDTVRNAYTLGAESINAKIKIVRKRGTIETVLYESSLVHAQVFNLTYHYYTTPSEWLKLNSELTFDVSFDMDVEVRLGDIFTYVLTVNFPFQGNPFGVYNRTYIDMNCKIDKATFIELSAKSVVPASTASLAFVHEALSRVAENITNNGTGVASTYYGRTDSNSHSVGTNGKGSLKVIGSGLRVRNASLTGGGMAFSPSFLDLMKGLAPIDNVGWGFVGSQLRVESWEYFYNNTTILTITSPSTISRIVNKAAIFSRIKAGFSKFESEGVNGLDAFCTDREYSTSVKAIDTKLEIISPFVADSYAFEKTRRLQGDKATTDSNYDENIFILCLKRSSGGAYSVDAGCTDAGTTVISPNYVYNARISPVRNLKRWAKQLLTFNRSNNIASFGSGTCNYLANITPKTESGYTYNYDADTTPTAENADVTNSAELLKAETVTIKEYAITMAQYNTIKANPYGTVLVNGEPMFIKELRYKRKTGLASFTLLPKKV